VPTPSALLTLHCAIDNIPLLVDANAVSALEVARVLVMTDIVDSTATTLRLGDRNAAALWASHDRIARDLLQPWRGREIDKSDGFLLLFETVSDALGYATAYHATLAASEPRLQSRAAIHLGPF